MTQAVHDPNRVGKYIVGVGKAAYLLAHGHAPTHLGIGRDGKLAAWFEKSSEIERLGADYQRALSHLLSHEGDLRRNPQPEPTRAPRGRTQSLPSGDTREHETKSDGREGGKGPAASRR